MRSRRRFISHPPILAPVFIASMELPSNATYRTCVCSLQWHCWPLRLYQSPMCMPPLVFRHYPILSERLSENMVYRRARSAKRGSDRPHRWSYTSLDERTCRSRRLRATLDVAASKLDHSYDEQEGRDPQHGTRRAPAPTVHSRRAVVVEDGERDQPIR